MAIGEDLLSVPMGEFLSSMARAIADAQFDLDSSSIEVAEVMSGQRPVLNNEGEPFRDENDDLVYQDTRVFFGFDRDLKTGERKPLKISMMELGFTPNFYQFVETSVEVKVQIKMTRSSESDVKARSRDYQYSDSASGYSGYSAGYQRSSRGASWGGHYYGGRRRKMSASARSVDAEFSAKYNYSAEGSSVIRTKLVPVPPPSILEERVRLVMDQEKQDKEILRLALLKPKALQELADAKTAVTNAETAVTTARTAVQDAADDERVAKERALAQAEETLAERRTELKDAQEFANSTTAADEQTQNWKERE